MTLSVAPLMIFLGKNAMIRCSFPVLCTVKKERSNLQIGLINLTSNRELLKCQLVYRVLISCQGSTTSHATRQNFHQIQNIMYSVNHGTFAWQRARREDEFYSDQDFQCCSLVSLGLSCSSDNETWIFLEKFIAFPVTVISCGYSWVVLGCFLGAVKTYGPLLQYLSCIWWLQHERASSTPGCYQVVATYHCPNKT